MSIPLQTRISIYNSVKTVYTFYKEECIPERTEEEIRKSLNTWFRNKIWDAVYNSSRFPDEIKHKNDIYDHELMLSVFDECNGDMVVFKRRCYEEERNVTTDDDTPDVDDR